LMYQRPRASWLTLLANSPARFLGEGRGERLDSPAAICQSLVTVLLARARYPKCKCAIVRDRGLMQMPTRPFLVFPGSGCEARPRPKMSRGLPNGPLRWPYRTTAARTSTNAFAERPRHPPTPKRQGGWHWPKVGSTSRAGLRFRKRPVRSQSPRQALLRSPSPNAGALVRERGLTGRV
jgi:hypothetical protein